MVAPFFVGPNRASRRSVAALHLKLTLAPCMFFTPIRRIDHHEEPSKVPEHVEKYTVLSFSSHNHAHAHFTFSGAFSWLCT